MYSQIQSYNSQQELREGCLKEKYSNTGNSDQIITVILIHTWKYIHVHVITSINADFTIRSTSRDNSTRDRNGICNAVLTASTSLHTPLSSHNMPQLGYETLQLSHSASLLSHNNLNIKDFVLRKNQPMIDLFP